MATTTWTSIRDRCVSRIAALTPAISSQKFQTRPVLQKDLRAWSSGAGSAALRAFDVVRLSGGDEAMFMDPSQFEVTERAEVVVAYPTKPFNEYGTSALDSIEAMVDADASQIRDAITSAGNYVSGQNLARVTEVVINKDAEEVWFCVISFHVVYYRAQVLV